MKIKAFDLKVGDVFRFIDQLSEYVVIGIGYKSIDYLPIDYNLGTPSKSLDFHYTVDIPPYSERQLTLF